MATDQADITQATAQAAVEAAKAAVQAMATATGENSSGLIVSQQVQDPK